MEKLGKIAVLVSAIAVFGSMSAHAQEVAYALPRTTFSIEVEAVQEHFYAGPYAGFAQKLLNMKVSSADAVSATLTRTVIKPCIEADPSAWLTSDADNALLTSFAAQGLIIYKGGPQKEGEWLYPVPGTPSFNSALTTEPEKTVTEIVFQEVQTDTGMVSVPVEHKALVEKTLEDKAEAAAEMILLLRKDRLDIVTGNTDATYYGNSMEVALAEISRMEKEYMALFEGYTVKKSFKAIFEVTPSAEDHVYKYPAFRLREDGFTEDGVKGVPYYLELEPELSQAQPEDQSAQKKGKGSVIKYRIPVISKVTLTRDGEPVASARIPVYQFGKESQIIINTK